LGSSIVYWAGKEVASRQEGSHLGLHNEGFQGFWFGERGMVWKELIPKIEFLLRRHLPPKFVVIQLGSNDLGTIKGWQLAENIICDILRIHSLMSNTLIVWSDILQRRYWHNVNNGKSMEKTRKRVNLLVRNQVISIEGCALRHCNLRAREISLYRNDGTHLSNSGTEIYLNNIQGALERFISSGSSLVFPSIQA
jgi:lysophospholipase L1-like esterase